MLRRFALALSLAAALGVSPALAQTSLLGSSTAAPDRTVVSSERVRAELLAHAPEGVAPGKPLWVGLRLTHQPEWHTYWKNPGDSGLPTSFQWTLPDGVRAGEVAWPVPRKIPIGTLANYGYEGTVLLAVPLTVAPNFQASGGDLRVRVQASWLVCRKECIPEDGDFSLRIPMQGSTALQAADFEAALASQPRPLPAGSTVAVDGSRLSVSVAGLPAAWRGKAIEFFPETAEVIETAGAWTQSWKGDTWTAQVPLSPQRGASPSLMPVVLALQGAHDRVGWRAEAPVSGAWPAVQAAASVSPALAEALQRNAAISAPPSSVGGGSALGLWAALLGALLGGLILNLMPCVFPILAIKVVGFTRHGQDATAQRLSGVAYTAGVITSFIALGALFLALRAAGEQLGWGFQLQSPAVVATLAALFTVIGLNLAGLFEFGHVLPSGLASLQARHPAADAFLSGVLAVAIASPCTAPFMGASIGVAVGLPAWQALAVFAVVGVGMALPYLAASLVPAVARALPRPGPWMDTFRRLMAFPMFATVAWLVWVLGQQSGIDGAAALLVLLVALAALIWSITLAGRARAWLGALTALVLAALLAVLGPSVTRLAETPLAQATGERWQAWAPGKVEQLVGAGQPVFVDFTAAWCVTCQYNKKTTLSRDDVLQDFATRKVALLRADWTRRDPAITAALAQLGRSGVPVYVLYAPGRAPVVLTEVLGADELRAQLQKLQAL